MEKRGNMAAGLELCQTALTLAAKNNFKDTEADALNNIGLINNYQGDYPTALEFYPESAFDKRVH